MTRTLSPRAENALLLILSAAELLTILTLASPIELGWHTATVAALLLRRRWPVPVLLATLPTAFTGYLLIAPMVALYQVARDIRSPRTVGACALLIFLSGLTPWWPGPDEPLSYQDGLFGVLSAALLSGGPMAVGRLVRTRAELSAHLIELARTRGRERQLLTEQAAARERARLAREMHDSVSHHVSLISVQAGAWEATAPDPHTREAAATIRELGVRTLEELRSLVGVLRSAPERPGLADLAALVETSGLAVRYDRSALPDRAWPEPLEQAAFRIVQEALTNVRKYAPGAETEVRLTAQDETLVVEIRNGRPASPTTAPGPGLPTGGHGLLGLQERVELLGGQAQAGPTPEGGFRVHATLPG
ncbi:histidine kinase [Streptomyces albiaxialis]|uniref:histidine kinase n=1 Tax=Streptomyces albiaxialis TaxID=329523 RepID=A0ABP5IQK3_9ACTN